jgi:hypothetical protein
MPAELPYMFTVGNISAILDKIRGAGTPPRFTNEFLKSNLGFSSSNDRGIIKILKQLGFLAADGTPTARYNEFRSHTSGGLALAQGLREGWAPIFLSDERAYDRTSAELQEIFKTVTGAGSAVAVKMAGTFKTLAAKADWSASPTASLVPPLQVIDEPDELRASTEPRKSVRHQLSLHHDVHVHLPATSDVAVYRAIFRALREELL